MSASARSQPWSASYVLVTLPAYVLRDLFKSFVPALLILSFSVLPFFLGGMLHRNIGVLTVLSVLPFLFPFFSGQVFPPALLIGTVLCYGRIGSDNEYTAVQAGGVWPGWIVLPALAVGVLSSLLTLYLNEQVLTYSTRRIGQIVLQSRVDLLRRQLAHQGRVQVGRYHIYRFARGPEGHQALDITEYGSPPSAPAGRPGDRSPADRYAGPVRRVVAQDHAITVQREPGSAGEEVQSTVLLHLTHCYIENLNPDDPAEAQPMRAASATLPLPVEAEVSSHIGPHRVACWGIGELVARMEELDAEFQAGRLPERDYRKSLRKAARELQTRLSLSFSCILFAVVGTFLGLVTQHSDRAARFGVGFVVLAGYFLVYLLCRTITDSGGWLMWLPNILLAVFGLALVRRVLRPV